MEDSASQISLTNVLISGKKVVSFLEINAVIQFCYDVTLILNFYN